MELFGGCHYLKDSETHEVICIARFKVTIALQILSAWGLRYIPVGALSLSCDLVHLQHGQACVHLSSAFMQNSFVALCCLGRANTCTILMGYLCVSVGFDAQFSISCNMSSRLKILWCWQAERRCGNIRCWQANGRCSHGNPGSSN